MAFTGPDAGSQYREVTGKQEEGATALSLAIQRLQEQGHMPSLGEACAARARAMSDREDPPRREEEALPPRDDCRWASDMASRILI